MTEPERWIVIPNWSEYQHYKKRDPRWIKDYTRQLADDDYLALTAEQRGVLQGLRLMYAASDGQLHDSTRLASRKLNVRVTRATLEALNRAGYITFSASKPLALRYQAASPETEEEKETETPLPHEKKSTNPRARGTNPRARGTNPRATRRPTLARVLETWIDNGQGGLTITSVEAEIVDREKKRGEQLPTADRKRLLALAADLFVKANPEPSLDEEPDLDEPEPSLEDEPKAAA